MTNTGHSPIPQDVSSDNYELGNMSKIGIKWLDILEQQFDKSIIELDLYLNDLNSNDDQDEVWDKENQSQLIAQDGSTKMNGITNRPPQLSQLSSTFVQLAHKMILMCDANTTLERELAQVRNQLKQLQTQNRSLEKRVQQQEQQQLPSALQSPQRQFSLNSKLMSLSSTISSPTHHHYVISSEEIKKEQEAEEIYNLRRENYRLRRTLSHLKSDLYGSRLAAKYLEKEIVGRIQEIQVLSKCIW